MSESKGSADYLMRKFKGLMKEINHMLGRYEEEINEDFCEEKIELYSQGLERVWKEYQEVDDELMRVVNKEDASYHSEECYELTEDLYFEVMIKIKRNLKEMRSQKEPSETNVVKKQKVKLPSIELPSIDISLVHKNENEVNENNKIKDILERRIEESNAELYSEREKNSCLEKDVLKYKDKVEEGNAELEIIKQKLQEKIQAVEQSNEALSSEKCVLMNEVSNLKVLLLEHIKTKEDISSSLEDAQKQVKLLETECKQKTMDIAYLIKGKEYGTQTINKLKDESSQFNERLKEEIKKQEELIVQNNNLKVLYECKCKEILLIEAKTDTVKTQLNEAVVENKESEKINNDLKDKLLQASGEIEVLKKEVQDKNNVICSNEEKYQDLKKEMNALKLTNDTLNEVINRKGNAINNLQQQIVSIKDELQMAQESNKKYSEDLKKEQEQHEKKMQEMMLNVEEYRQQYVSELKANEETRKDASSKMVISGCHVREEDVSSELESGLKEDSVRKEMKTDLDVPLLKKNADNTSNQNASVEFVGNYIKGIEENQELKKLVAEKQQEANVPETQLNTYQFYHWKIL